MEFEIGYLFVLMAGLFAGLVAGGCAGAGFFWRRVQSLRQENDRLHNLDSRFGELSQNLMRHHNEQFLQLAQEKMRQAHMENHNEMSRREESIKNLVDPMNKALKSLDDKILDMEKTRVSAYSELREQVTRMTQDQIHLRKETSNLVQALRSPNTRGQWGEMQLKRCLEMAGMKEKIHYETQVTTQSGQRPDIVIKLTGGHTIIIDSKAPLESYLNAFREDVSPDDKHRFLAEHAAHVRGHMKTLGSKSYWKDLDTPEFVVMFLPGESYFSAALEKDPSLIEFGVEQKVIPATPTTLISLLKAVMYGWRQEQLAENAKEISAQGVEIYRRITTFGEHMDKLGGGLRSAIGRYNDAVGSLEKSVLPAARKLKDMHIQVDGKDIPDLSAIDLIPRDVVSEEFDFRQDKLDNKDKLGNKEEGRA